MFTKNYYKMLAYMSFNNAGTSGIKVTNVKGATAVANTMYTELYCNNSTYRPTPAVVNNGTGYGVTFGNGTTAPTVNDIKMSGTVFTDFTATASPTLSVDDAGITLTTLYTITNTGDTDFTISEIGLFSGTNATSNVLVERTLLDEPVTIAAGGIGQVTYTIRCGYPTT